MVYIPGLSRLLAEIQYIAFSNELDYILLFILFFALIFTILNTKVFKDQRMVNIIIAVAVSMIAVWTMSYTNFDQLMLTYRVFGIVALGGFSLAVLLYFLHGQDVPPTIRRIVIAIYGIIIYSWTYDEFSSLNQQYPTYILLGLIVLALIFDDRFHKFIASH